MRSDSNEFFGNRMRGVVLGLLAFVTVAASGCGLFGGGAAKINVDSNGNALGGYDAVAYFTENLPREGNPAFTATHAGAKWQFVSAVNRDMFVSNPEKYMPQYGGYCSWAVGHNYTANADPEAWKIVDGKLYLNYNKAVQSKWMEDIPKFTADGDKNWQVLAGKAEESRKDR